MVPPTPIVISRTPFCLARWMAVSGLRPTLEAPSEMTITPTGSSPLSQPAPCREHRRVLSSYGRAGATCSTSAAVRRWTSQSIRRPDYRTREPIQRAVQVAVEREHIDRVLFLKLGHSEVFSRNWRTTVARSGVAVPGRMSVAGCLIDVEVSTTSATWDGRNDSRCVRICGLSAITSRVAIIPSRSSDSHTVQNLLSSRVSRRAITTAQIAVSSSPIRIDQSPALYGQSHSNAEETDEVPAEGC